MATREVVRTVFLRTVDSKDISVNICNMDTILDTSVLRRYLSLRGKPIDMLVDYLAKTQSKAVLTSIVLQELSEVYRRELQERLKAYRKAKNSLRGIPTTISLTDEPDVDLEIQLQHFVKTLYDQFGVSTDEIVPYRNEYLSELVSRAVSRKKPMDGEGQQFRDGLLWLSTLDYAEARPNRMVAFISGNTSDFADSVGNSLAPELLAETEVRGVTIKYYPSLEEFIKSQAARVDFVNHEWVESKFDFDRAEQLILPLINSRAIDRLGDNLMLTGRDRRIGPFESTGEFYSQIVQHFVYEKQDGSLILNVEVASDVGYAVLVERDNDPDRSRWEYVPITLSNGDMDLDMVLVPEHSIERNQRREDRYVSVKMRFAVSIVDMKLEDYEIVDWDWEE